MLCARLLSAACRDVAPRLPMASSWLRYTSAYSSAAEAAPVTRLDETLGVTASDSIVSVDTYGAISLAPKMPDTTQFRNVDGQRIEDGRYAAFLDDVTSVIPKSRHITDPLRTFAYGSDASFYRLIPKAVVMVHNEEEMSKVLPLAKKHNVPVTFRAAGTSLSGQAITDSVLLKVAYTGRNFRKIEIHGDGSEVSVEPGVNGGDVNRALKAFALRNKLPITYKIGPDPASIDAAMIGGIVANNASGMCCGVAGNSYHTVKSLRIVFVDGTVLDTADPASREAFEKSHADLCSRVSSLAGRVQADRQLANLIRRKFSIKNTVGYSLNALVDFPAESPIDIIQRLLVGSEGTLAFVSRVTYSCVPEWDHKASVFMLFPDITDACEAARALRDGTNVDAVELFDASALVLSDDKMRKLVPELEHMADTCAALLIECRGREQEALHANIQQVYDVLKKNRVNTGPSPELLMPLESYKFNHDPKEYKIYWDFRKGTVPIVGGARQAGTQMMIEDIVVPIQHLAKATRELQVLFRQHGYADASFVGHALEGNLHIVFSQGFRTPEEVATFGKVLEGMAVIVADKYGGSLKGEHGTGRNMAPFVEMEWGRTATAVMHEIKDIFDPSNLLNPGVVLNEDVHLHMRHLKPSPPVSPTIDRCIECGFCEPVCPSRDVTVTPRQRIQLAKEMGRLQRLPEPSAEQKTRLEEMSKAYDYYGNATCAVDGMCQTRCPVSINTGEYIKQLRVKDLSQSGSATWFSTWLAHRFGLITASVPTFLNLVSGLHGIVGAAPLRGISALLNRLTGNLVPVWQPYMAQGAPALKAPPAPVAPATADLPASGIPRKVVYFPSCVTRMMGPSRSDSERRSVPDALMSVLSKAGYEVIIPEGVSSLCCGMLFDSRGLKPAAGIKLAELQTALLVASENGKLPVLTDTSPCLATIKDGVAGAQELTFSLFEPVGFINNMLSDKLEWSQVKDRVAVHVPCTSKRAGLEESFARLAGKCAGEVHMSGVSCCGMAGERGLRYPELTAAATQHVSLPADVADGYSTARTCEMGMSAAADLDFRNIVFLVDEATKPKATSSNA